MVLLLSTASFARAKVQGIAGQGGQTVVTSGLSSTTKVIKSYPSCTVTVYLAGTITLATIYTNNSGTLKANPFTAGSDASWFFYGDNGRYDIRFSGVGITSPFTLGDVNVVDPTLLPSSVVLQTNNVNNASQSTLNLKNGVGINITDGGAGNITVTSTATGLCAGANNILDYGADPTGVVSSRQALVDAYFYAATTNKKVCMPSGTYLLTIADFNFTGHQTYIIDPDIEWFGAGMGKTIIKIEENITPSADPIVMFVSGARANIHDFTIQGATSINGTDSPVGIGLRNSKGSFVRRVQITNLNNNIAAGGGAAGAIAFEYTSANAVSYEELSSTTLGTNIASGTRTVTPADMTNIAVGRRLKISGPTEYVVVTALTQTTFTSVFANAHITTDTVIALGEGHDAAIFEDNEVRDCYNCSAFVVNAQGGRFYKNRMINGGNNSNNGCHAFYVQAGGNVFEGNYIEYFGLPSIQEYPGGTGNREMTANRWIGNDVTSTRHFFTSGTPQINDGGNIVSVPVNYSLQRQQILIGNHFRTPWKFNVAGVNTVGSLELGPRVIFEGNYLENSFVQQVPLASDIIVESKIIGNTFVGIEAIYAWGILVRDNATIADNKFINISTSSTIGTEAPISAGSFSTIHDNRIIGGNYLYAIFVATAIGTKVHDNIITGATAGAIAEPKALGIRGSSTEVYGNYIDGNAVISVIDNFVDAGASPGTIKFYNNVIKNFALSAGRIIRHDNVTQWATTLDFHDNDISQMASVERNSKKLWAGGRNISVDTNQNELVGYDSNGRFTDITVASTRFFGVFVGPTLATGVFNDDIWQFAIYEAGAECTVKADGAWTRGNVGIISTTAARKIHDTGVSTPPASFATSYVIFLDSGGGVGSAKVRIIKGY